MNAPGETTPPVPGAALLLQPEDATPGVHVERRTLLHLPLALVGGRLWLGTPLQDASGSAKDGAGEGRAFTPLTHEEFGRRWQRLGRELRQVPPECDESYAGELAAMVARLPLTALPTLANPRRSAGFAAGPTWFLEPCAMIEFQMEPGAELRLHNHPPQVVLTLCAKGEVAYRHFELEGEAPPCTEIGGAFLARETRAGFLGAGRTTCLTRARDGIHGFRAGEQGARIVDFTVSTTADIETFSYIDLAPTPVDAARRVYEAVWLGKT